MVGGAARWESPPRGMSVDSRTIWADAREQNMEAAWREAQRLLSLPQNAWAEEAIALYMDSKDHFGGLRPEDLTAWGRACFRAIRQGSGGCLGNPSLL